jgi:hypothetical protein
MNDYGYLIDHVPAAQRCCEVHNINCEAPGDLCCGACAEFTHPNHSTSIERCVLARCDCQSEQAHLDATKPGYAGERVGMREPA